MNLEVFLANGKDLDFVFTTKEGKRSFRYEGQVSNEEVGWNLYGSNGFKQISQKGKRELVSKAYYPRDYYIGQTKRGARQRYQTTGEKNRVYAIFKTII